MSDFLQFGTRWLDDLAEDQMSQPITYRRGAVTLSFDATFGRRELAVADEAGAGTVYHATDFLFKAAKLDFGSGMVEPAAGDVIVASMNGKQVTFTVMDETESGKHFEYSGPDRESLREHAKQTGTP